MNKAQLTAKAQELGHQVPENATNAEIKALIAKGGIVEETSTEEVSEESVTEDVVEAETPEGVYVTAKGLKYKFSDRAPKQLQIDGKVYPITEIINNDDLMEELVESRAIFIEQIYN